MLRSRKLPRLPVLHDKYLRHQFAGAKSVFTVPELESYARCPFQYLLRFVWKLKQETDGLDGGKQSALLHSVLRKYFRKRARRAETVAGGYEAAHILAELQGILAATLRRRA